MQLQNLRLVRESAVDQEVEWVKLPLVVKKVKNLEVVYLFQLGSKVDKAHYIEEYLSVVLTTSSTTGNYTSTWFSFLE